MKWKLLLERKKKHNTRRLIVYSYRCVAQNLLMEESYSERVYESVKAALSLQSDRIHKKRLIIKAWWLITFDDAKLQLKHKHTNQQTKVCSCTHLCASPRVVHSADWSVLHGWLATNKVIMENIYIWILFGSTHFLMRNIILFGKMKIRHTIYCTTERVRGHIISVARSTFLGNQAAAA